MLRKFLAVLLVSLVTFGLFIHEAEAKRFGGGRSFGMSRSTSSFSKPTSNLGQNYSQSQRLNQPGSSMNRWLGPLAGLAVGGLLASLFMSNGIGSGILSWLLVGGLMLVLITLIRNKMQPKPQPQYRNDYNNNFAQSAAAQFMRNSESTNRAYAASANNYPVGFDEQSFLRDAKIQFIRLQAAYDQKNLNDIREFTAPEVFAEIQMQLQERGNEENKTDVMSLEAELLGVEEEPQMVAGTEMQSLLASVRFNGLIQENRNQPAASIKEIWHFRKELASMRWTVVGVQQE